MSASRRRTDGRPFGKHPHPFSGVVHIAVGDPIDAQEVSQALTGEACDLGRVGFRAEDVGQRQQERLILVARS
jgi:hypothetical protein